MDFSGKSGTFPFAIAKANGCLVKTNKAKLMHALEEFAGIDGSSACCPNPKNGVWLVDGMALLQQLNQKHMPSNFGLLAKSVLNQLINLAVRNNSRCVHFVTDTYPKQSIKNAERKKRAAGGKMPIKLTNPAQTIPTEWKMFMADSANKQQLIRFFFLEWSQYEAGIFKGVEIVIAHDNECHSMKEGIDESRRRNRSSDKTSTILKIKQVDELFSDHEEADTRMLLHAYYVSQHCSGKTPVIIRSPDTDVLVIGLASSLKIHSSHLYFNTGTGKQRRTIDLNAITQSLGADVTEALIGLHCVTGCDAVSAFHGKGKVKPFELMRNSTMFQNALKALGESFTVEERVFASLEAFVCSMYGYKDDQSVNEVQMKMIKQKKRAKSILPNSDSLRKHILRANFQARIYKLSLIQNQNLPTPVNHGWKLDDADELVIDWMTLPTDHEGIIEYTYCSCKIGKCKTASAAHKCCVSHGMPCTDLCQCKGCENMNGEKDDDTDEDEDDDTDEDDSGEEGDKPQED